MTDDQTAMFIWLGEQLKGYGYVPNYMQLDSYSDAVRVSLRGASELRISHKHISVGYPNGRLYEGAIRCMDCKTLRPADHSDCGWCRHEQGGCWRDVCPSCFATYLKRPRKEPPVNDRVPMTEGTRRYFERDDVREFVAAVRALLPGAQFYRYTEHTMAFTDLAYVIRRCAPACTPEFVVSLLHDYQNHVGTEWTDALREGRALLEDPPQAELAPADPPATVRPVCAHCGQTCWREERDYEGKPICSDCSGDIANDACGFPRQSLDPRIAAAQSAQRDAGPWDAGATPAFEWEEWR